MERLSLKRMAVSQKIVYITFFIFSSAITLIQIYIVFVGLMQGLKTHAEVVLYPFAMPAKIQWKNYLDVFTLLRVGDVNFLGMVFNNLWYSAGCTILGVGGTFCLTYVISKYKFPGSQILNWIAILVIMIPIFGGTASYKLIYTLGFNDSPLMLIVSIGSFTGPYLIVKGFLDGVSWSYAEAAFIDGASDFQVMYKVMLPQVISPLMAVVVMQFISVWNNYQGPLLYMQHLPTISVGLYVFERDMIYKARMDILFAACIIAVIPLWVIYGVFNKTLLNITVGGGLKG